MLKHMFFPLICLKGSDILIPDLRQDFLKIPAPDFQRLMIRSVQNGTLTLNPSYVLTLQKYRIIEW
jgi:hypothetical protein